ncbi:hypothetical protein EGT74_17540 [Chitinophaga lutea]|uniref:Uncharacterized protein n=2 Tax=Chitinophaga lutea TaxID=2488634 RepID=A0A3N4PUU6_9BACT|nr:hypothetical protein EGT74_17540 [Chitinophaga lutea]
MCNTPPGGGHDRQDSVKYLFDGDGFFCGIKMENADSSVYRVVWGRDGATNVTTATFDVQGNGTLELVGKSRDAFILSQGCGTSCTYDVILPLTGEARESVFMFVKAIDTARNLIAYIPETDSSFIRVENYLTRKKMDIPGDDLCPAAFKGDCIDSCFFEQEFFVYSWNGKSWSTDNADLKQKKVPLELK